MMCGVDVIKARLHGRAWHGSHLYVRTSCRPIQYVIILMIKQIELLLQSSNFVNHSYDLQTELDSFKSYYHY